MGYRSGAASDFRKMLAAMAAVALVLLAALPGVAVASEPDAAAPVVSLSGTAVKAVEEGKATGTYELHIAATDGSKSAPQSGVAKIEVGVDGSGQQSWEKNCPEGSCGLEESWTYSPASFSPEFPRWITVKVTDHAGNATEEEISIEGLEEVPREAAPTGSDTTAPTISFSGSAVEALETGATTGKYELRMFAKDGSPSAPQSGISKVEIGVDGTMLQSWEKYCPVGSCRLKQQWTYIPANYSGTGHVMTIVVHDHAGNVTTRTIGPDTTPPTIELSGPLTEGLKEGITTYPLHVHATDGNPEFPGSGVKKITISVDGSVVKSVEQGCINGSCPMDTEWVFNTATYGFGAHEIMVTVEDQAANKDTAFLPVAAPNGSIPACSSAGEAKSAPDEVKPLPGGGTVAIYHGFEGEEIRFPSAPAGFNPKTASEEQLENYGFPPKPPASESAALKSWEETVGEVNQTAAAGGCMEVGDNQPEFAAQASASGGGEPLYNGINSGYVALDPNGSATQWRGAYTGYTQPELTNQCAGEHASLATWTGVGGVGEHDPFFQAGTNEPYGYSSKIQAAAFTEYFVNGHTFGETKPNERPMHVNLRIAPGDRIQSFSLWNPKSHFILMGVINRGTVKNPKHEIDPVEIPGAESRLYDGRKIWFNAAERPTASLQSFNPLTLRENLGLVTGNGWAGLSHLEHLRRQVMQETNSKGEQFGQIMASPGPILADGLSFTETWKKCHP
jgi:hypothetical protein